MAVAAPFLEHLCEQARVDGFYAQLSLWAPGPSRTTATVDALWRQDDVLPFVFTHRQLAAMTMADPSELSIEEALAMVVSHIVAMGCWASSSAERMARELARWERHLRMLGVERVADITTGDILEMLDAPNASEPTEPRASTRRFRRAALRLFFRSLRQLHISLPDPTIDIQVEPGVSVRTRPLTDDEELLGRVVSGHTLTETRRQVAWALGQATATTGEQSQVRVRDVDLGNCRVWLSGTAKRKPRWGDLTEWGVDVIGRAVRRRSDPQDGLVYMAGRSKTSGAASACKAVHDILKDAGLSKEPGVRPGSLPAWRGAQILAETEKIQIVAKRLGVDDIEEAAKIIGWDWRL